MARHVEKTAASEPESKVIRVAADLHAMLSEIAEHRKDSLIGLVDRMMRARVIALYKETLETTIKKATESLKTLADQE